MSDRPDGARPLADLSASTRLVLAAIQSDGGVSTRSRLMALTHLPERTVAKSLADLRSAGYVTRKATKTDARVTLFAIKDDTPSILHLPD